jgi:hypothetical protein
MQYLCRNLARQDLAGAHHTIRFDSFGGDVA